LGASLSQQKPLTEGFTVQPLKYKDMKFLASFFALALYFIFALADTAEEITYTNVNSTVAATPSVPASEINVTIAHTPRQEKAGFAF
jgi:hypothetical protein